MYTLHLGNCLHELRNIPENSIDSVVCDPPYELGFMSAKWDQSGIAYSVEMWKQALRVLKPGGHLLAFSGSRTYHRMTCAIEDAGFEIRDQILWVYGSGFPKSLDVSKAIDKAAGAERTEGGRPWTGGARSGGISHGGEQDGGTTYRTIYDQPATQAAKQWQGWGTALKPAHEPICVARKPLAKGLTVAANVLAHGTGALNIDGCRVENAEYDPNKMQRQQSNRVTWEGGDASGFKADHEQATYNEKGRWPANLIHDGSDEVVALFPNARSAGAYPSDSTARNGVTSFGGKQGALYSDTGSAARFFYCAKTSKKDRNEGCEALPQKTGGMVSNTSGQHITRRDEGYTPPPQGNNHPTVKPTDLMRYLCRLVTPPGGTVLDPFMGSGSTGKAAVLEGFRFVGIEMDESYHTIAKARIEAACVSLFADMI
jgi:site-specific DNA-methyltransferase (adenine-specific)